LGLDGRRELGGTRIALLEGIAATGSLTRAAEGVGISYRTAWTLLGNLNGLSHAPLVESVSGGTRGGGSRLTAHGRELLATYHALRAEHARFVAGLAARIDGFARLAPAVHRLTLSTSARNQLHGTVRSIRAHPLHADVTLAVGKRGRILARITRTGLESLGLKRGDPAFAVIKANWVSVVPPGGRFPGGANRLPAKVAAVRQEGGTVEWDLLLPGGGTLIASAAAPVPRMARLGEGRGIVAVFDPRHVILGLAR
jgi:molybdate transport system regulatory protein